MYKFLKSLIPDYIYIFCVYCRIWKKFPNFNNPQGINEKLNWLKINDRKNWYSDIADKIKVRNYVKGKGLGNILIPLHCTIYERDYITLEDLPNDSCVVKVNHNSGGVYLIDNNVSIENEIVKINESIKKSLKENYYKTSREWQYNNIQPGILVEQLLVDDEGRVPSDYKFHCFNGKVQLIQIDSGRFDEHKKAYLNKDFELQPFMWATKKKNGGFYEKPMTVEEVNLPDNINKMVEIAEILSEDFLYIRVDLYDHEGDVYFGELTFHHLGGTGVIEPYEYEYIIGNYLDLGK